MKRSRRNLYIFFSFKELVPQTDFIGLFIVLGHNEHYTDDSANQAPHVWEVFISFVEFSLESGLGKCLLKDNLDHGTFERWYRLRSEGASDSWNIFWLYILKRQEADIGLDGILTDFSVNSGAELARKEKSILIVDVVLLILFIPSIDKGVYHRNHGYKMSVLCLNKCKHAVIHASCINRAVAPIHLDANSTENIRG